MFSFFEAAGGNLSLAKWKFNVSLNRQQGAKEAPTTSILEVDTTDKEVDAVTKQISLEVDTTVKEFVITATNKLEDDNTVKEAATTTVDKGLQDDDLEMNSGPIDLYLDNSSVMLSEHEV